MLAFYWPHRRYFIKKIGHNRIIIGATTSKGKINLKTDFERWRARLT